eukprot:TRINITY_DN3258_c0_g1_i1.p1 TRINITY_DN3258_c0_g1~~TRINITY_DN3258_c0_g1_i1.p1  ORF type:complete len:489 (-),score=88.86 TRINITY_DN3258_c0_g1_i1:71-1537(-)
MPCISERTWSWITICFAVTLQGIDYGIIIPSMLEYMTELNGGEDVTLIFGIVVSIFSTSSLVTAPLFGWAFDKYSMRSVMIVLTIISGLGALLYALAINNWMILIGRVLCGAGYNIFPGSSLYVVQTTTLDERSGYFAKITLTFSIALALGPAINFPLSKIHKTYFGPFQMSQGSAPGWVMTGLFVMSGLLYAFFFTDPVPKEGSDKETEVILPQRSWKEDWKILFTKGPCVILIITQALVLFTQTTVETILTPLTSKWYHFDASWNSLLFTGMVGVIVLFLVIINFLTKRVQDRALLMTGHLIVGFGNVMFVIFLVLARHEENMWIPLWQFCIVTAIYIAAIAFYQSILGSLFSKLLNDKALDGRGQSMLSGASSLGSILGPLASTAAIKSNLLFVPSIMGGLWSIVLCLLIASWDYMYVDQSLEELEAEAASNKDVNTSWPATEPNSSGGESKGLLAPRSRTSSESGAETSIGSERLRQTNKAVNF